MAFTDLTGGTGPALAEPRLDDWQQTTAAYDEDRNLQWFRSHLRGATPDEVRTFVSNNVTDLASARQLLTLMLLWMARAPI